ncbi:LysR substrate-binding domain-containing protein [Sphingosinicella sp. LHD-64]|uniref:LysR substrate-binding domain-containing protein n=1 Tax=Sphingosinicella sp. LHD-64 TaxID=3072139 RepID=UPI00280E2034|nr:LysR substrate-binding domain-containing protein [Sphingosinicella sp. LHD-64]MDQ8755798.1 LysR substrate-binding domain-containing protein [Sphingosinicella sp. LHD-64]
MVDAQRFPSLASIRAFEAAARLGNFAGAARELDMSAASVSYHVRQLERQLGLVLFIRHPQRVALTEAGSLIAGEATKAFAALRASFVRAADLDEARLSITTLPTLGTSWLTPRLGRFRALHPEITVALDLSAEPEELGAGRFDAAIRNGHGRWPGLRTTFLFPAIFTPLCAPALKSAAAKLVDPDALPDVPLLGRPDWWTLWYRALGAKRTPAADRFGTSLSAEHLDVAAALAGHGIAIASPILFRSEIEAGRLVPVHDLVTGDGRAFWFVYPVVRQHSAKLARFRDWLGAEAEQAREAAAAAIKSAIVVGPA